MDFNMTLSQLLVLLLSASTISILLERIPRWHALDPAVKRGVVALVNLLAPMLLQWAQSSIPPSVGNQSLSQLVIGALMLAWSFITHELDKLLSGRAEQASAIAQVQASAASALRPMVLLASDRLRELPEALRAVRAKLTRYEPSASEDSYFALTSASVTVDVGTTITVYVLDEDGVPMGGVGVLNLRPDGNYELLNTVGNGSTQFIMGPGSKFFSPNDGPHRVGVGYLKGGTEPTFAGDQVYSLGLPDGHHADFVLAFRRFNTQHSPQPPAPQPDPVPDPAPQPPAPIGDKDTLRAIAQQARTIADGIERVIG